jgi:2-polyprenyl-6-methoxyphenol hydroxylase-like FAD-dependent oxidoreductase
MAIIETDVLIVGAGPTGLTLACQLAARGVNFRITEAAAAPQKGSRGKGIQPRTLELLDDMGIGSDVIANGAFNIIARRYDETGSFQDEALHAHPARPDAPYLSSLLIPQFRIEEKLRAKLSALGGSVAFGSKLSAFAQECDTVTANLEGPEGPTSLRCRYLVGCDGGKSSVRQLAGISFAGETLEQYRMLLGDVRIEGLDRDHWHIWRSKAGFFALCPLPSTDLYQLQGSVGPGQEDEVSLAAMQRQADARATGVDIRIVDADWMSLWRANIRMVDRYRSGNVFLAGDAAHVHSPAGGQGMNTGIQDGYNLGWKLAAVLGGADPALLDSYQEERLPIAAWVLGLSTDMMNAVAKTGQLQFRRDEQTLQLGLNYRHSALSIDTRPEGEGLRAGDRAPDAPGLVGHNGECRLFELFRGPHWTLIGMGDRWRNIISTCVTAMPDAVQGYVIGGTKGQGDFFDRDGNTKAAYGVAGLFVIRPDNYIGLATDTVELARTQDYLRASSP